MELWYTCEHLSAWFPRRIRGPSCVAFTGPLAGICVPTSSYSVKKSSIGNHVWQCCRRFVHLNTDATKTNVIIHILIEDQQNWVHWTTFWEIVRLGGKMSTPHSPYFGGMTVKTSGQWPRDIHWQKRLCRRAMPVSGSRTLRYWFGSSNSWSWRRRPPQTTSAGARVPGTASMGTRLLWYGTKTNLMAPPSLDAQKYVWLCNRICIIVFITSVMGAVISIHPD